MYTQEIVEFMSFIMGARRTDFDTVYGVEYPLMLKREDRSCAKRIREAFLIRNNIVLFLKKDKQANKYWFSKPDEITLEESRCMNLSKIDVMYLYKCAEDTVREELSFLNDYKKLEPHYQVIANFVAGHIKTFDDLERAQDMFVANNQKFQLGIYVPCYSGTKDATQLRYLFKNDYLFLKTIYNMDGKKLNLYLDYYKNSASKELIEVDDIITSSKNYEVFIDCDNANSAYTYLLITHLSKLPQVKRVNLFYCDDLAFRWELLKGKNIFKTPVERVLASKNSCDIILGHKVAEAIYTRGCKDIMIVSCDSDYFGIVNNNANVNYTVLTTSSASKRYVERLTATGVKNYNLQEMFSIADVVARVNAKTSYYTDLVAAMMYDEDDI